MSGNTQKIGKRVKAWREERKISRETLAELTGLELDFIIALEDKDIYPSIGPLQKISRVLGVRLGTFMDDQISKDPIINRIEERKEDDLRMQVRASEKASFHYHSLAKGKSDRNMEPFIIDIEPDGDNTLSSHEGEEFMYVIEGELTVVYGKETHILKAGDSIYYNSIVPHHVGVEKKAKILAVLSYPL